jgi:hypothetical protein
MVFCLFWSLNASVCWLKQKTFKDNVYRYNLLLEANSQRLYLTFVNKDITFGYCLNLTFVDVSQYYGLIKMSPGWV